MSYGLLALLDDIAALAKMSAASLDDIAAHTLKTSSKTVGIIIDDAAVTPKYVTGISPSRELPAIFRIARWSVFNKILVITPLALILSALLPQVITPLLMLGGCYLAFEGAEKVIEMTGLHGHEAEEEETQTGSAREIENRTVKGAIRTDFILSTEIMVMTLATVEGQSLGMQIAVMVAIALIFTFGVYGVVALIVRTDDVGVRLARAHGNGILGRLGKALVRGVPGFLEVLGLIGTVAMLWVGGHLVISGLAEFGMPGPEHWIEHMGESAAGAVPALGAVITWGVGAFFAGLGALVLGGIFAGLVALASRLRPS